MTSQIAVLCVDDEKIVIDSLKRELTQVFGDAYVIEVAQSGDDAFEAIRSLRDEGCDIAVALVDYILRNEKGDDLLRRIHDALPQTKTIMLTGQATPEGIGRAVNYANLYRFIAKPWHRDDLALGHVEIQVVEDLALPVAAGQLVDLEHACFLSGPNTLR